MFRSPFLVALTLGAALVPASLLAQGGHYRPADGALVSMRVSDAPTWKAAYEQSRFWQLCQMPDIAEAIALASGRYDERDAVLLALIETVAEEGGEVEDTDALTALRELEQVHWEDLRGWVHYADGEGSIVVAVRAGGEDDARIGRMIERIVDRLVDGDAFVRGPDGPTLDGLKAEKLVRKEREAPEIDGQWNSAVGVSGGDGPPQVWYWRRDGLTVVGIGENPPIGTLGEDPTARHAIDAQLLGDNAGAFLTFDLARAIEQFDEEEGDPEESRKGRRIREAFGVDVIRSLSLALGFDGEDVRESLFVETSGEVGGLLGAWLGAAAPLPAHPQVDDAMMQLGFALDLQRVTAAVKGLREAFADEGEEPEEPNEFEKLLPDLQQALTGGGSLQVSGPAVGSMVPRLSLALGVADRAAIDALIERAHTEFDELGFEQRETEGIAWTCVKIPNSPSALIPSYAFLDDVFVLAESPATLRALIRARSDDLQAMPVEAAPQATPLGDPVSALDVRYDGAAIWRVMQERYVPLAKLGMSQVTLMGGMNFTPLLEAREMPDLEPVGEELSLGRGGLTRVDDGFVLSAASTFGDPFSTALMATYVPLMPMVMGMMVDAAVGEAQGRVGAARVKKVHQALTTFRASFGNGSTLPRELGELFTRGLLESEQALLVPGDEDPAALEYEDLDGEIQEVGTSFRYSPGGKLKVSRNDLSRYSSPMAGAPFIFELFGDDEQEGEEVTILLYEQRQHSRGERLVLTADGQVHSLSEEGAKKILGQ